MKKERANFVSVGKARLRFSPDFITGGLLLFLKPQSQLRLRVDMGFLWVKNGQNLYRANRCSTGIIQVVGLVRVRVTGCSKHTTVSKEEVGERQACCTELFHLYHLYTPCVQHFCLVSKHTLRTVSVA